MAAYNIDFGADKTAAAGELTLHVGTKNRSGHLPRGLRPYHTASSPAQEGRGLLVTRGLAALRKATPRGVRA